NDQCKIYDYALVESFHRVNALVWCGARYNERMLMYIYIFLLCFGVVPRTSFALFSNASIMMLATFGATALLNVVYMGFANWNSITRLTSVCGIVVGVDFFLMDSSGFDAGGNL